MVYVIDTHPLIWFVERHNRLSPAADAVLRSSSELIVPSICLVELWHLYRRGRINVSPDDVRSGVLSSANVVVHPLNEPLLASLPVGLEIHDAVVVATALHDRDVVGRPVTLVTKDRQMTAGRFVDVLW